MTEILSVGPTSQMATYVNELQHWSASNNMQINKDKTKEMVITNSHTVSLPLLPNIERVDSFKLLGIVVSNDLKWNRHINYITHKVNSRLHISSGN